jgi:hypothetical protein
MEWNVLPMNRFIWILKLLMVYCPPPVDAFVPRLIFTTFSCCLILANLGFVAFEPVVLLCALSLANGTLESRQKKISQHI